MNYAGVEARRFSTAATRRHRRLFGLRLLVTGWLVTSCPLGDTFIFYGRLLPRAGPEQRCYSSVQPPMLVVFPSACNTMALSVQWSGCHMTTPWGMHRFIAGIPGPQESHVHVFFFPSLAPSPCDRTRRVREKKESCLCHCAIVLASPRRSSVSSKSTRRRAGEGGEIRMNGMGKFPFPSLQGQAVLHAPERTTARTPAEQI